MLVLKEVQQECLKILIIVGTHKVMALLDIEAINNLVAKRIVERYWVKICSIKSSVKLGTESCEAFGRIRIIIEDISKIYALQVEALVINNLNKK